MGERESRELTRREAVSLLGVGAGFGLLAALRDESALARSLQKSTARPAFPKGAVIRTILKDVPPENITEATLIHEHLSAGITIDRPALQFYKDLDLMSNEV